MSQRYVAGLALAALATGAVQAQDLGAGAENYAIFCASCHGGDATGDGPMASILKATPPDLTELAAHNGGLFPRSRVVFQIDGRDHLAAHGGDMPIFGDLFDGAVATIKSQSGQPILTNQRIADIVHWLESIQN